MRQKLKELAKNKKLEATFKFLLGCILFVYIAVTGIVLYSGISSIMLQRHLVAPGLPAIEDGKQYRVYEETNPIVRLYTWGDFTCSGYVASSDYVITAAHCVDELGQLIAISNHKDVPIDEGEVVAINDSQDIALIRIDIEARIKPAVSDFTGTISTINPLGVITCGFPAGQKTELCTGGILEGNRLFLRSGRGLIYAGMSGGPVFEPISGVVVAVNSAVTMSGILVGPLVGLPSKFNVERISYERPE